MLLILVDTNSPALENNVSAGNELQHTRTHTTHILGPSPLGSSACPLLWRAGHDHEPLLWEIHTCRVAEISSIDIILLLLRS